MEYQFESIGPAVRLVVLVFLIVFVLVLLGVFIMLAALPGRIANSHGHPQAKAVNICGWLGLPTGILWVLAMVWAYYRDPAQKRGQAVTGSSLENLNQQLISLEQAVSKSESNRAGGQQ